MKRECNHKMEFETYNLSIDCRDGVDGMDISRKEVADKLVSVTKSLSADKVNYFLSIAHRVLKELAESLCISLQNKDVNLAAQHAHKLKGSSNLYASQRLIDLLTQIVNQPESILFASDEYELLICEFSLVIESIENKQAGY